MALARTTFQKLAPLVISHVYIDPDLTGRESARTPAGALLRSPGVAAPRVPALACVCVVALPGSVSPRRVAVCAGACGRVPHASLSRERGGASQAQRRHTIEIPLLRSNAIARHPTSGIYHSGSLVEGVTGADKSHRVSLWAYCIRGDS